MTAPLGGAGCDRRRHSCTLATRVSQRTRFCQSTCSFLSKITLKIGKLEFEVQTQVHFWFWVCNCLTVTYCIKGVNEELRHPGHSGGMLNYICTLQIWNSICVPWMPQTTNYYIIIIIVIIIAFIFPSIRNPFIQFHTQAILFKDYVLNARNKAVLHSIWKTLVLVR